MKHFESPSAQALPKRYALDSKAFALCAAMLVVALLSATVLSGFFSSASTYTGAFKTLDDKRNTVLALTAASATASAALTLIPDDTCTPIAERLSEISRDFTYVVAALLLEKYLLTTIGFAFFSIIVPLCCAIFAVSRFMSPLSLARQTLGQAAFKLLAFGLVLFISTPASVFITSQIDSTYKDSIDATVQTAQEVTDAIQDSAKTSERKDPENAWEFLQQRFEDLQVGVETLSQGAVGALEWVRGLLGSFVEAFAVMLVTSIVIPILVPVVIYLAFKLLSGQQPIVVQQMAPRHLPPAE